MSIPWAKLPNVLQQAIMDRAKENAIGHKALLRHCRRSGMYNPEVIATLTPQEVQRVVYGK